MGLKISLEDLFGFIAPKAIAFGAINDEATVVGHDTPFPVFDSSLGKVVANLMVGAAAAATPGRYLAVSVDVGGNAVVQLADGAELPIKVVAGTTFFPLKVTKVVSGPVGTYHNLA